MAWSAAKDRGEAEKAMTMRKRLKILTVFRSTDLSRTGSHSAGMGQNNPDSSGHSHAVRSEIA